ncbi:hypothetical protein B0H13DRAFT_1995928 [Mycena leptocephala]|nr:hypothetical protein B0H13DRAFT_1995928 [Mycena leptocephala]
MTSKGTALVTGAAQGIGKAIALRLADDGFDVAVNDISTKTEILGAVSEEILSKGRATSIHIADVSVEDEVSQMVEAVVAAHRSLDVMIANAGVAVWTSMAKTTAQDWDRVLGTNARGVFLCYKHAALQMITQGRGGRIIGASSVDGKQGTDFDPAYSASKFAIRGLRQPAPLELGAHGITVNAYAPGAIDTDMLKAGAVGDTTYADIVTQYSAASPLRCIGAPADVASLVSLLASPEAQFITGARSPLVSVNGGIYFD